MALHSIYNSNYTGKIACGLPILPFKTKFDGPGNSSFQMRNQMDIIDEAFHFFRVNVLFKNFQIQGPADKLIVYLSVLISHLFKLVENIKDQPNARKRLGEVISAQVPAPKDKGNFMSVMLDDGNFNQRQLYTQYIRHIKAETVNRLIQRFYEDGVVIDDFKFWLGLSKKKFLGMNFTSFF